MTIDAPAPPPAPAPAAPPAPSAAPFLPPQASPTMASRTPAPVREQGTPLAVGTVVARIDEDNSYGDPTPAGIVIAAHVDPDTGTHQAIVGWFASTSHPVDTTSLTEL